VQQYEATGIRALGPYAERLAEAEGLLGHAEAIRARLRRRSGG
jgi:histidinol dehydrogenase